MKAIEGELFMTSPEVATRFGVSPSTPHYWRTKLGLKARRIGGLWYYKLTDVDAWAAGIGNDKTHAV